MNQHLSVRVPWHDHGWEGTVCCNPEQNQACRILKNIAKNKKDSIEINMAGNRIYEIDGYEIPCLSESGAFMSPKEVTIEVGHPYTYDKRFSHINKTHFSIEPYTFLGIPFKWMLRKSDEGPSPHDMYFTQYNSDIEPAIGSNDWISHGTNQREIFNYFYQNVKTDASLIVAYAKVVPFIETPGRIIVGIGTLSKIGELKEYDYSRSLKEDDITAVLWERQLGHTIREGRENGFLFPFIEIKNYLEEHPQQNPDELVVIAPSEYFKEFSYATELLSTDALIQILNKTIAVLKKYNEINLPSGKGAGWDICIKWCKNKLEQIWKERGAYPGLGAVLSATGIPYGFDLANVIREKIGDADLWEQLPQSLENLENILPKPLSGLSEIITETQLLTWKSQFYNKKRQFLELVSRFNLTVDQAVLLLNPSALKLSYADCLTDIHKLDLCDEIIANPYILYEKTRLLEEKYRFGIGQIDIAMFPDKIIKDMYPIAKPSLIKSADDKRRLRAIITSILENASTYGSTIVLLENLTEQVNAFRSDVEALDTKILQQTIIAIDDSGFFEGVFTKRIVKIIGDESENKGISYKLDRFAKIDMVIKDFVAMRLKSNIDITDEWEELLNSVLKEQKQSGSEHEKASRAEKVEAIRKMAQARISVLTGGAGTGKTTTLVALCKSGRIRNEGILVLAPTGKARVVLSQKLTENKITEHAAFTLFQYLRKTKHCDAKTWSYYLSGKQDGSVPQTVIIDECSMLTEEMFGALAETVFTAKRVIFVGDPNQLPPIGSGKPFFELVSLLSDMEGQPFFAELKISNRQKRSSRDDERLDVELAKLFTENQQNEAGEDIFDRIVSDNENIEFKRFNDISEIYELVFNTIADTTKMANKDDIDGFDISLGGANNGEWMNFNNADSIENWQIISPYRNDNISGSLTLNRYIHEKYRQNKNFPGQEFKKRITRHPLGSDAILYGDKVINIRNQEKQGYPKEGCENYIANGEIGIVSFLWEKPKAKQNTHQVIFSSQKNYNYNFFSIITDDESDLELAYVLTVHKVQGSGFLKTIFIINEPENGMNCFLSRELIYTALTRQSDKVYILYNKDPWEIKKYSDLCQSDLGQRLTNLFFDPVVREHEGGWYDNNLIHITLKGERVRSKSETLIANELYHAKINYIYEKKLLLKDGSKWLPDFTLQLNDGKEIYWEHLGMLGSHSYRKRWEYKKEIYAKNGIAEDKGNLKVTQDDFNGGFNTIRIKEIIETLLSTKEPSRAQA